MDYRTSGITSIPANSAHEIGRLKAIQDATTAQLASDTTGLLGNGDYDHHAFLTPIFEGMRMAQAGNTAGVYGTLALLPEQQNASFGLPYYQTGTPVVLDRAGSGNNGFNIIRAGTPPVGYLAGDNIMVKKRFKKFSYGDENDPANTFYVYEAYARPEPKGYVLQAGESLDGNFFPGSVRGGVDPAFGNNFAFDSDGHRLYSNDPLGPDGWNGVVNTVPYKESTLPVITSIAPNTFQLPVGNPGSESDMSIVIHGSKFTGCGFCGIGPFFNSQFTGAIYGGPGSGAGSTLGTVTDTAIEINPPQFLAAGVWDVYVVGIDGQIGVLTRAFTVLGEP